MKMNLRVVLLLAGLIVGGLIGYLQRPEAAEIKIGPVEIEVQSDRPAQGSGPLTSGQMRIVLTYAAIGGVIGLAIGFVADRRKPD
jgi:uncharacterized membrane-anchored protein YhcB (DUF1043 family)